MSIINKYRLFNEFRGIGIWGPSLEDAVMLQGHLQESDMFTRGAERKMTPGQDHRINGAIMGTVVLREHKVENSKRGDNIYVRALLRAVDGKLLELHATVEESHETV